MVVFSDVRTCKVDCPALLRKQSNHCPALLRKQSKHLICIVILLTDTVFIRWLYLVGNLAHYMIKKVQHSDWKKFDTILNTLFQSVHHFAGNSSLRFLS